MVMTYGWIFVVGIGAVIIMSQMGTFTPAPCEKTKYGFSQLMPTDWGVYMDSNRIVSKVENWAGDNVQIIGMHVSLDDVSCDSAGTVLMAPGQSAVIIMTCGNSPKLSDKYIKGSCYTADVSITYIDVASGATYVSKGTVRGPVEEGSVSTTTSTPMSDLTITSIYATPGGEIRYVISNPSLDGPAPISMSNVSVWDSSGNPVSFPPLRTVDTIPIGGTRDEPTGLDMATCPTPGANFIVKVYADWPNDIPEQNELNNWAEQAFFCPGPDQPPIVELISPCDCCSENGTFIGCP